MCGGAGIYMEEDMILILAGGVLGVIAIMFVVFTMGCSLILLIPAFILVLIGFIKSSQRSQYPRMPYYGPWYPPTGGPYYYPAYGHHCAPSPAPHAAPVRPPPSSPGAIYMCPSCSGQIEFVPHYGMFYCGSCQRYI